MLQSAAGVTLIDIPATVDEAPAWLNTGGQPGMHPVFRLSGRTGGQSRRVRATGALVTHSIAELVGTLLIPLLERVETVASTSAPRGSKREV